MSNYQVIVFEREFINLHKSLFCLPYDVTPKWAQIIKMSSQV